MDYLRLILSQGQVAMDPVKVAGVQDWPVPCNVTEVNVDIFGETISRVVGWILKSS